MSQGSGGLKILRRGFSLALAVGLGLALVLAIFLVVATAQAGALWGKQRCSQDRRSLQPGRGNGSALPGFFHSRREYATHRVGQ